MSKLIRIAWVLLCLGITACAPVPPSNPLNICKIYSQYPQWYFASQKTNQKWGVPPAVQMAIIYQESSYNAYAKPPRGKLLWLVPWTRPTTAEGYAQATNGTWENYIQHTGNSGAVRSDFADSSDFIGWYASQAQKRLGIAPNNAYQLYLAYHDGLHAHHRTQQQQYWVMQIAHKVERIARLYTLQLARCQKSLPSKHWWN